MHVVSLMRVVEKVVHSNTALTRHLLPSFPAYFREALVLSRKDCARFLEEEMALIGFYSLSNVRQLRHSTIRQDILISARISTRR